MPRWTLWVWVGLLIVAASSCGVTPRTERSAAGRTSSVPDSTTRAMDSAARTTIDSLRAAGRYDAALTFARSHLAALGERTRVPDWLEGDARREAATLEWIVALPESARAVLASADASVAHAEQLEAAGDLVGARRAIDAQLATREHVFGPRHLEVARSLSALARLELSLGETRRAYDLDQRALEIRRAALGDRHLDVAESMNQVGLDLKTAGGKREPPMKLYRDALDIQSQLLGSESPEAMGTLLNIANLYRVRREPDSALVIFQRVLDHRRAQGAAGGRTADVLFSMAMTITPRGQWREAEPWLREAVADSRRAGRAGWPSLARIVGAHGIALRHMGQFAAAESALSESAQLFEVLRRGAPAGWGRSVMYPLAGYPPLAAAQLELGHDAAAWISLERSLGRTLIEDLVAHGAIDTTGWWNGALARVQRSMADDEALVGWLTFRPGAAAEEYPFWCYTIRRSGPVHWRRVDAPPGSGGPSDLALIRMGKELSASAAWPLRLAATDDIRRMGFNVYRERLAPLEPWLRDVKQLVVVGPGMFLQGLPVEALVDSSGSWLGDRFVVSYAPSALLHAHSASTAASRTGASRRWRALVVGDPVPSSGVQPAGYPSLAAAQSEMRDLATLVDSSSVLLGAEASAERLRQLARAGTLERFQLVHFATHSAVDEVWLGQSALVLSGTDRDESARIRSDEISNTWRLDADLVTLAACRAIGGPASSLDGYLGLHQALLGAGARHLLASVWRVDDQATALLMGRFYRLLLTPTVRPMREAEALAQARRWLREWRAPDGSTPYAHPAHWASFVLFEGGTSATRSAPAARDHFTSTTLPSKRPPEFTTR